MTNEQGNGKIKNMYRVDLKDKALAQRIKHTQRETCEVFGVSATAVKSGESGKKTRWKWEKGPKEGDGGK
jgi:hypothetical protein